MDWIVVLGCDAAGGATSDRVDASGLRFHECTIAKYKYKYVPLGSFQLATCMLHNSGEG